MTSDDEEGETDVADVIDSILKLSDAAMAFRQKKNMGKALKLMEKAVAASSSYEHSHPAIAVEGARARLNLGAMLSMSGRHPQALESVRAAKQNLESVLAWSRDCVSSDVGVMSIASEASSLNCAALVAEAIELESVAAQVSGPSDGEVKMRSPQMKTKGQISPQVTAAGAAAIAEEAIEALLKRQQLYAMAQAKAEEELPESHPMTSLVKKFNADVASPQRVGAGSSRGVSLPPLGKPEQKEVSPEASVLMKSSDRGLSFEPTAEAGGGIGTAEPPSTVVRKPFAQTRAQPLRREEDRSDIFSDFLRTLEANKTARLNEKNPRLQEEAKKKLGQLHRTTQLLLDLSNDEELKEKRYSKIGHKVVMNSLTKENRCRSDPSLSQEARRYGAPPEVLLVKKLTKVLNVKPATPPPPPPPKPQAPEELKTIFGTRKP